MYSVAGYGQMIADAVRMEAYSLALRRSVKPDAVVVDIGTGTGILAMLACRYGARRVFAIEPSDVIQVARDIAQDNGMADRIEFIQAKSIEVDLPERADVIVSDLRGVLPFHEHHLPAIADARQRMLAPGGVLIPQRDTLWIGCVAAEKAYERIAVPWLRNPYGLDMHAALPLVTSQWSGEKLAADHLMAGPGSLGSLDYATVDNPDFAGNANLVASRAGTAHGLCVWFDATLSEGVGFSNSPDSPDLIYGRAYFPWPQPVELRIGQRVSVTLKADLVGDNYLWSWDTRIDGQAPFHQSSFFAEPLSPSQLRKTSATHVARLNEEGIISRLALGMMEEGACLGDIARNLASRFPKRFSRWQDALTHLGALSTRYSR